MRDSSDPLPLPPGSMGWPILGDTLQFIFKGAQIFIDKHRQYGGTYKMHLLGRPSIRVNRAEHIRALIGSEPRGLIMQSPKSIRMLFGPKSITNATDHEHTRIRKSVSAAFTPVRLADYLPCVQEHIRSHMLRWSQQGQLKGFLACEEMVCDIVLELVLGCHKDNDRGGRVRAAFVTVNQNLFSIPLEILRGGFYKSMKARKVIEDFVRARLKSEGDKDHVCMLDVFLATHRNGDMTEEEIVDNAMVMLIASTGTTTGALCCLLLELGRHPEVMNTLRKEVDAAGLMTSASEMKEDLSYQRLQSLEYCQCVIRETLRLHVPAGGGFREAQKTLQVDGYQIPQGWSVIYSFRETHATSTAFEDKESFSPERWLHMTPQDRLQLQDSCHYIPFGHGPHSCVGKQLALMKMGVFLVELSRLVTWKLHNPAPRIVNVPITKPADDLPVTFSRIE